MSDNTGDLIISLAKQGGIELDETQTTAIQEIATDLPEGISTKIQGSLFTKESALANPEIINKLKAESLDAVDQKLQEMAKSFGLDEGFIHNLKETKGTFSRMDKVGKTVLESHKVALEKAASVAPAGDQKELNAKIKELNDQIAGLGDTHITKLDHDTKVNELNGVLSDNARAMLGMKANSLFSSQNWAMDTISSEANVATANGLFNAELQAKNVKLVDDNGTLKLQTQEGTPYYVDNIEVTPQGFANTLLSGHKLLKVTDTKAPGVANPTVVTQGNIDVGAAAAAAKALASHQEVASLGQ